MALTVAGTIEIPDSTGTAFDHGAFEPETRRVFIAHTARDSLEVVDADTSQHVATLRGFPEAAGVVAGKGSVLVTNRGGASVAWVAARTLETRLSATPECRLQGLLPRVRQQVRLRFCPRRTERTRRCRDRAGRGRSGSRQGRSGSGLLRKL
jgi:hypothetical protein